MNALEDLFPTMADFRRYAPYTESNITFELLNSSALTAKKQIIVILSQAVYNEILAHSDERIESLRSAMANLTLAKQMVFDVIAHRKNDVDIYKSEQEAMRRAYMDNYYNAMDSLVHQLFESSSQAWQKTRYAQLLTKLQIPRAELFDELYPIDLSYLFFFRTIPYQVEALDEGLITYFQRSEAHPSITPLLLRALAKATIAIALRRLDIAEFPPTIRNLFSDSTATRNASQEQSRILALADSLTNEVQRTLSDIDLLLTSSSDTSISTQTSYNRPDDKIYLMA